MATLKVEYCTVCAPLHFDCIHNVHVLNSKASRQKIPMEDVTQTYCLKLNRICLHHMLMRITNLKIQSAYTTCLNNLKECCTYDIDRTGGTGPAALVLAGPIFQTPTIHF